MSSMDKTQEAAPTFDAKVKAAAEHAVLKFIGEGGWLMPNYEARLKLPADWMAQAWALVDREALLKKFAERIESEVVDRMVNHMAAELATDIKQILSVKERREILRGLAREHMDAVMKVGTSSLTAFIQDVEPAQGNATGAQA